ncbi:MAG TPA: hypothetical protein VJ623_10985 [Holophagaceae bacterium]|nr:hypothetical protein [Holophagaceae bacterium]
MSKHFALSAALLILGPAARAQVSLHIDIGLPIAPPLVVVRPGIQVVEGFGEEVFFHEGWYWCRRDNGWYRARSPRARFEWVEVRRVPRGLVALPPGHYRNWHREREHERRELRREVRREERHEERREDRRERERGREERGRGHRGEGRGDGRHRDRD